MIYPINNTFFPGNEYMANAHAAGTATSIWPNSTAPVCRQEFQNITKNPGESKSSSTKGLRVGKSGNRVTFTFPVPPFNTGPNLENISPLERKEFPAIMRSGSQINRQITDRISLLTCGRSFFSGSRSLNHFMLHSSSLCFILLVILPSSSKPVLSL